MRILLFFVCFASAFGTSGQSITRTYDRLGIGFGVGEKANVTSVSYSQELLLKRNLNYSFGIGLALNRTGLPSQEFLEKDGSMLENLTTTTGNSQISTSIPVSFSIGKDKIYFGGSVDIVAYTFKNKLDNNNILETDLVLDKEVNTFGARWILNQKSNRFNLRNQLFLGTTIGETLTLELGLASQQINYNLYDYNSDNSLGEKVQIFGSKKVYPFFRIIMKNEK